MTRTYLKSTLILTVLLLLAFARASAQAPAPAASPALAKPISEGISLAPARVELEMLPGAETTVVVNLDYHGTSENSAPVRIVASLNDWTLRPSGEVEFDKANTLPNSASPWVIFSPTETTVIPGNVHAIRVTITVPKDATPGDHLTSLIIEQRPDTIKFNQTGRQVVVRYRMAAVFYIKVPKLTRVGSLENLKAEAHSDQVAVTPTLKNQGNSVLRPLTAVKVIDASGKVVAELAEKESIPVLGGAELIQPITLDTTLAPGSYNVKYRVDFQDGSRPTEGVTDVVVGNPVTAANATPTGATAPAKP